MVGHNIHFNGEVYAYYPYINPVTPSYLEKCLYNIYFFKQINKIYACIKYFFLYKNIKFERQVWMKSMVCYHKNAIKTGKQNNNKSSKE